MPKRILVALSLLGAVCPAQGDVITLLSNELSNRIELDGSLDKRQVDRCLELRSSLDSSLHRFGVVLLRAARTQRAEEDAGMLYLKLTTRRSPAQSAKQALELMTSGVTAIVDALIALPPETLAAARTDARKAEGTVRTVFGQWHPAAARGMSTSYARFLAEALFDGVIPDKLLKKALANSLKGRWTARQKHISIGDREYVHTEDPFARVAQAEYEKRERPRLDFCRYLIAWVAENKERKVQAKTERRVIAARCIKELAEALRLKPTEVAKVLASYNKAATTMVHLPQNLVQAIGGSLQHRVKRVTKRLKENRQPRSPVSEHEFLSALLRTQMRQTLLGNDPRLLAKASGERIRRGEVGFKKGPSRKVRRKGR